MTLKKSLREGFTLIEILIVVAIIAILASVVLVGLGPTQQAGRDARRVSDLHEVQNGLELYYNKCGYYAGADNCTSPALTKGQYGGTNAPNNAYGGMALALTNAATNLDISSIPLDPSDTGTHIYLYANNSNTGATSYVLQATLENPNSTVFTSYTAPQGTWANGDTVTNATCGAAGNYCVSL